MTQQLIFLGTGPNTKNGDTVRNAFAKVNQNFTEVYTVTRSSLINGDAVLTLNSDGSLVLPELGKIISNGKEWRFDSDGNLILPAGGSIKNSDGTAFTGSPIIDGGHP
jgi:hypothetical protein